MIIFKVSCYSDCGSYFQPYLQSVTLVANSREEAQNILKSWINDTKESFVKSNLEWEVLAEYLCHVEPKVIDYTVDSDY